MKNAVNEIKNATESICSRVQWMRLNEWFRGQDLLITIRREKKIKMIEESLHDLWDLIKKANI